MHLKNTYFFKIIHLLLTVTICGSLLTVNYFISHQNKNTSHVSNSILKNKADTNTSHYLLNEIFEEEEDTESTTTHILLFLSTITAVILLLQLFNAFALQKFQLRKNPLLQAHTPVYISLQNFRL